MAVDMEETFKANAYSHSTIKWLHDLKPALKKETPIYIQGRVVNNDFKPKESDYFKYKEVVAD